MVYLDSSAIVKRYILEPGTEVISNVYYKALNGEVTLSFSAWNIGEVLGTFDRYYRREWLEKQDYMRATRQFIGETLRLLKIKLLRIIPVKTRLLIEAWRLIKKHHIYEADALQIVSAKHVEAHKLYTADRQVHEVSVKEGVNSEYIG